MPPTQTPRPFIVPKPQVEIRVDASRDVWLLATLATIASVVAFVVYYLRGEILLYGDAVAHINIARRVFDSRTPGPSQLGTVWLPLNHLAMLPFVIPNWMWRTGIGGSIPSMAAYVASTVGLYRLVRSGLAWSVANQNLARASAWAAAVIFAANPSVIYLQTTAMTEVPYLAFFIWAAVFFSEFVRQGSGRSLLSCGAMLFCCTLIRYDGWFALGLFGLAALAVVMAHGGPWKVFWKAAAIAALGPVLWLGWNTYFYQNPLEFANGPYSAKAIAERTTRPGDPHYPGWHSPSLAARQFVKSTRLTLAGADLKRQDLWPAPKWYRLENLWFPVAGIGVLLLIVYARWMWPWLLLWTPLPFYAWAIAYGSVPIFLPSWWPYSYYNVRYGTQLLPAVAGFVAAAAFFSSVRLSQRWRMAVWIALGVLIVASYVGVWRHVPAALREPQMNSAARVPFERQLAAELRKLPPDSVVLMFNGEHVGSLEQIAMPLRRTINESNYRLWQAALADPARYAEYVVATDDDPVAKIIRQHAGEFQPIARVEYEGQRPAVVYRRIRGR